MKAAALGNYIYPVKRLLSTKYGWGWETDTVFLSTEYGLFGAPVWSEVRRVSSAVPIFSASVEYILKRYTEAGNGGG